MIPSRPEVSLKRTIAMVILAILLLTAPARAEDGPSFNPVYPLARLTVEFADQTWGGQTVPFSMVCPEFGGKGLTPQIRITHIPKDTNALIMEYSDLNDPRLNNGGMGRIGIRLPQKTGGAVVPSVSGQAEELPEGFFALQPGSQAGVYQPPCSGGKNHLYYLTVKAVHMAADPRENKLLGVGMLRLGTY